MNRVQPLYIFDLDGTLALVEHRRPILDLKDDPQRWKKFYEACVDDLPNMSVINTLWLLARMMDIEVRVWSGRSNSVRRQTQDWLIKHVRLPAVAHSIQMREEGDFTPDEVLKRKWYDALPETDRSRLVAVFDDRDKVVAMWRDLGVTCFQVAPGNF